jgi:hypothetical protein
MDLDLTELTTSWISALTKPAESTFEAEKPKADLTKAIIALVIGGVVSGFFSGVSSLLWARGGLGGLLGSIIVGPIIYIIAFFIVAAILYVTATVLGGKGDFTVHVYLGSLIFVPVSMINAVLGLIPILGGLVGFLVGLYALYPYTFALKVTFGYSTRQAVITWGIWVALGLLIAICSTILLGATFLTLLQLAR